MIDWQSIGIALAALASGAGSVALWWRKQVVASAKSGAEVDVVQMMRDELSRLGSRVAALEAREGRLIRHVYRLEAMLRQAGLEPPAFDIESDSIAAK